MRLLFKPLIAIFFVFIILIGIYILIYNTTNLKTVQIYSVLSGIISILLTFIFSKENSKNWFSWFLISFFLFYQFGTFLTLILTGDATMILNVATTFSNSPTQLSQIIAYALSGISIALLSLFNLFLNFKKKEFSLETNNSLLSASLYIFYFTTFFVLIDLIFQLKYASTVSYASLYMSESQYLSPIPFSALFKSFFNCSFYTILASIPSKKIFKKVSIIFLFITLIDSLKGGRGLLVVNIALILWYYSNFYNIIKIHYFKSIGIITFLLIVLIYISFKRDNVDFNFDLIVGIFSNGISTSQYHLAIYLDYQRDFISLPPFFVAPLVFPFYYLFYGNKFVGQSEAASEIRFDLTHVMPSTLNHDAYLSGAGTGSALLSESIQYGLSFFFVLLFFFFIIYNYLIDIKSRYILLRFLSILFFMHLIISPRESISINLWGVIKNLILFYFIRYLISPFINFINLQNEK
jgi:hypothetical protein